MVYLDYEFTAVYFSSRKITLCIIPYGAPVDTTPEKVTEIWDDILMCFIQGRFYAVAHILNTLPYQRDYAGTFEIMGPLSKRKEIFHLLTPYRDKAPNISLAIRVKFFRFPKATDLTVEHWIGRTWKVRQGDIPPRPCKKKEDTFTS